MPDDALYVFQVFLVKPQVFVAGQVGEDVFGAIPLVDLDHEHLFRRDLDVDLVLKSRLHQAGTVVRSPSCRPPGSYSSQAAARRRSSELRGRLFRGEGGGRHLPSVGVGRYRVLTLPEVPLAPHLLVRHHWTP